LRYTKSYDKSIHQHLCFFIKFGDIVTFGASPELLDRTTPQNKIYLEALAGTIRRGSNPAEDKALAGQLLSDEKEVAEHNMMVDLARNDVGRVSKIGSVRIDDLMYVKEAKPCATLIINRVRSTRR